MTSQNEQQVLGIRKRRDRSRELGLSTIPLSLPQAYRMGHAPATWPHSWENNNLKQIIQHK